MKLNTSIYFKDTPFQLYFQYELSYILVPLMAMAYYFIHATRPIFIYHMIIIGTVGTIDTLYKMGTYNGYITTVLSIIFHLALLFVLCDFDKYGYNIYSLLLLLLANLIIVYLPYWPYKINKNTILIMYNMLYISLLIINYVITATSH